jgi:hypothetical protein
MTKSTNTPDFNDQAVDFSTFAVPTAGETAPLVAKDITHTSGQAARMLALATALTATAAANVACGGGDEPTPVEPTLQDHPRANTIGVIKNLGNSTHPGIQVTGYEGVTPGSIVPTQLTIDFTTDNPQNKAMLQAWIKAFKDYFPNEGFDENTTVADIDVFLKKDDKNVIGEQVYLLDKNGNRVDIIKEWNLHTLSELTKKSYDLKTLILDNPAAKALIKESKYHKNGEELISKELLDGTQLLFDYWFNSPYVGGTRLIQANINQTPMRFVSYVGK